MGAEGARAARGGLAPEEAAGLLRILREEGGSLKRVGHRLGHERMWVWERLRDAGLLDEVEPAKAAARGRFRLRPAEDDRLPQQFRRRHDGGAMAYARRELSSWLVVDPAKVQAEVLRVYEQARCSLKDAADILGCNYWTLLRWVKKLDERGMQMTAKLEQLAARARSEGWHHGRNRRGGRPAAEAKR